MLTKFSVENYKTFKDKIILDLSNPRDYDFNKDCLMEERVIKNAIIFGNNGCGKSNFSLGLFDIVPTLTDKNCNKLQMDENSFLNFDSKKKYATFEYEFLLDGKKVIYTYKKTAPRVIVFEQLIVDNQVIFTCNTAEKRFEEFAFDKLGYLTFNYSAYDYDISFLKFSQSNTSHDPNSIIKKIINYAERMLWFRSVQNNSYIGIRKDNECISPWIIENNYVNEFENFLRDVGGVDLKFDVAITNNPLPQKTLIIVNSAGNQALAYDSIKSSGTEALELLFFWYKQMENASFVFVDEFDAFYHFTLARRVIEKFKDIKTLQALFSSHNTYLSNNEIFRPDCYFTIANGQLKCFSDRTKREIREGHNLEKLLRSGEFGE